MKGKYKITFEIEAFDGQIDELKLRLAEKIEEVFDVCPENIDAERMLSEEERIIMQGTCVDSQAVDEYCEGCPSGCIGCQREWLKQLGWKEKDLPQTPFELFKH